MANPVKIRTLRTSDLNFADRVRAQAGWNQTPADWRRLLELEPRGCFLAEGDGVPLGTATTTVYGGDQLAWIGMVLVDEEARRKGVGTALLRHCIGYLKHERRVRCIKLDATPEGQALYEKLGFVAEWGMQRWQASTSGAADSGKNPTDNFSAATFALDSNAFGADRAALLRSLAADAIAVKCEISGFGIVRPGARASYLGPLVADSWAHACEWIDPLLAAIPAGEVFWDIPDEQAEAIEFAKRRGYSSVRSLVRMTLDGVVLKEKPGCVFAIAEPALG